MKNGLHNRQFDLFDGSQEHVLFRPPRKELFPVSRVGKNKASREVGNLFFPPNFIFYKLECTGGKSLKKKKFENRKKKVSVGSF